VALGVACAFLFGRLDGIAISTATCKWFVDESILAVSGAGEGVGETPREDPNTLCPSPKGCLEAGVIFEIDEIRSVVVIGFHAKGCKTN
jgi:hypothetical protein